MAVSFSSKYLSSTKFTSDEITAEKSALLTNATLTGNLTLGETTLTAEQLSNLAAHAENNPQFYITGDYQGILPSTYEAHVVEFNGVKNELDTLRATVSSHESAVNLTHANTASLNDLTASVSTLNEAFTNVPDFSNVIGSTLIQSSTNISEILGDISTFDSKTVASTLNDLQTQLMSQEQSLNVYKEFILGDLDNSGNIGTNLAPGKSLIHCIGDLDGYGEENLISQFNVAKTNVEMSKDRLDVVESDLSAVTDDVALLKMAESGAFGDATTLWAFVGSAYNINDNTRDGWYPLFVSNEEAIYYLQNVITKLSGKLKYTLSHANYLHLFQEIAKFKVATIAPIPLQQPHILTPQWSGDDDIDAVYYTIAYDNGTLMTHNGIVTYTTSQGEVTTEIQALHSSSNPYPTTLKSRITSLELEKSRTVESEFINTDSTILYSQFKFNQCHPNLYQKQQIHFDNFLLFGLSETISFNSSDVEKVYDVRGKNENADILTAIRSGYDVDIIFNFLIGPVPHTAQFNLQFFVNENSNILFELLFRWAPGNVHTIQMKSGDDESSVISRFNPVHYLQLKYSPGSQTFSGVTSTRHILTDTPVVDVINIVVDKSMVLDWIESVGRRISIAHYNDTAYNLNAYKFYITGLAITTQN